MSCDIKSKKKNVQFDIVNTTSNPIFFDLFKLDITETPTSDAGSVAPPTAITSSYTLPVTARYFTINPITGFTYVGGGTNVLVYDTNNILSTTIVIAGAIQPYNITYCPSNNSVYVGDYAQDRTFIIDCNTNTVTATLISGSGGATRSLEYISSTNEVWVTTTAGGSPVFVIDVPTSVITIPVYPVCQPQDITFDSINNIVYIPCFASSTLWRIDATTKVLISQPPTPFQCFSAQVVNGLIYLGGSAQNSVAIFDIATLSFLPSVSFGGALTTIYQHNFEYVPALGLVYAQTSDNRLLAFDEATTTFQSTIVTTHTTPTFGNLQYNYVTNNLQTQANRTFQNLQATISVPPLYISGAVDYNFFVNNIENEPIKLDCVKFISTNQDQLSNVVGINKIDADGNEKQYPEIPILDVSSWQEQGNRATVPFDGLILDGRTFFSRYKINANETVVLELCYEQLNRFCFSQHPELFTSLKPIAKEEKEKIENKIIERDKKESGDSESKFEIIKDSIVIDISVTNNTANTSTFNFFQANQNQLIVNTPSVNFADVDAYNYLVQQLRDSPLVLNAVEVVSSDQNQLTLPVSVTTDDANGDSITYQHFPINRVSTGQQQGNRVIVKTNHLILDGYTTFASYNILPNTTISFVLYYRQFNRSLFLKNHFFTKLKTPIFDNGMDFAEEIEYFNEVTQNAKNKNSFKNNSKNKEKNINFGTEQVYSVGFNGERTANPFLSISKNKVVDNEKPINQEKYNYRDVKKNNHDVNTYKKNIY